MTSALALQNTSIRQQFAMEEDPLKRENPDNIGRYMKRKGMSPSPLEFIKLIQTDPEFANRFCYCNRSGEFY